MMWKISTAEREKDAGQVRDMVSQRGTAQRERAGGRATHGTLHAGQGRQDRSWNEKVHNKKEIQGKTGQERALQREKG